MATGMQNTSSELHKSHRIVYHVHCWSYECQSWNVLIVSNKQIIK